MGMLLRETLLRTLLCEDVAARLRGPNFGPPFITAFRPRYGAAAADAAV